MKTLPLIILLFLSVNIYSQDTTSTSQEHAFDFWVGNWSLEWVGNKGEIIKGTNIITKTLDAKVIKEIFEDPSTGFKGTSISVYKTKTKTWHQAWADNQGGYYSFVGEIDGDKRIFKTLAKKVNDNVVIHRMVFHDITPNKFIWDWESSKDDGKTWKLNWQINYTKVL
ncbi:MAG: hypothetical protein JKX68_04725 [Flavobacteriales bacterium]|nr:hypothetical protein [Flavobacteriales bacterium]